MNPESLPRWRILLLRHRWTIAGLLVALVFAGHFIRKERALRRLYQKQGGVYTHAGWLRKNLPPKAGSLLRSNRDTRAFARSWGRLLEGFDCLWWCNPEATDEGLRHLRGLKSLQDLQLNRTGITDEGLRHLGSLKALEDLDLQRTAITDAGLPHLYGLPNLDVVDLQGTKVTREGVAKLKAAVPRSYPLGGN